MSYEAAAQCARAMGQLRQFELAGRLGVDRRTARAYLARMQHEGVVSRMDHRGWHHALDPLPMRGAVSEPAVHPAIRPDTVRPDTVRLDTVRRLIARELHPDACGPDDPSKPWRAQMFQRIWPKLNEISRIPA